MMILYYTFITFFILLSVLLCATILIQESKSLGLGASFGGDAGDSLFGTSTADVLKKFTAVLGVIFVISCIVLSLWSSSLGKEGTIPPQVDIEEVQ